MDGPTQSIPDEAPEPLAFSIDLFPLENLVDPIPGRDPQPQSLRLDLHPLDELLPRIPEVEPQGQSIVVDLHRTVDDSKDRIAGRPSTPFAEDFTSQKLIQTPTGSMAEMLANATINNPHTTGGHTVGGDFIEAGQGNNVTTINDDIGTVHSGNIASVHGHVNTVHGDVNTVHGDVNTVHGNITGAINGNIGTYNVFNNNYGGTVSEHVNRTLVLCFDGARESDNSNVMQLCALLEKEDPTKQMIYYRSCTGTFLRSAYSLLDRIYLAIYDLMAWDLDAQVVEAYKFLMNNYKTGNLICIFGLSRGAHIARALSGMLYKVGLLPAGDLNHVPLAYKLYTATDAKSSQQSTTFKHAFSLDVQIQFLGVWDTPESVGLVSRRRLPFTASNVVRTFRHALGLDERRAHLQVKLWDAEDVGDGKKPTDVEEVWFAGSQSDIGGISVTDNTEYSLSRIPFRWMVRECLKANPGVLFDWQKLKDIEIDPANLHSSVVLQDDSKGNPLDRLFSLYDSPEPPQPDLSETTEGGLIPYKDALSPLHDQLNTNWGWWIPELLPMKLQYLRNGTSQLRFGPNLGRGRIITGRIKVHHSVKVRIEAELEGRRRYKSKAVLSVKDLIWVDCPTLKRSRR